MHQAASAVQIEAPFEPEELAEIKFSSEDPGAWAGDALIVGIIQEDLGLTGDISKPALSAMYLGSLKL